ncbi:MAG: phenylalanyl-tRNA synthetase beta chain, partial [Halothiobacillaceae bacterium]
KKVDFFDIKADVESILGLTRGRDNFIFTAKPHSALHPGQSAAITTQEQQPVGWVGALHPQLAAARGISGGGYLFQIRLNALGVGLTPRFEEVSKFPSIRRDIALVVERGVSAAAVVSAARASAGTLLQAVRLFDVYQGEGIDSRRKSLALGLILQDTARTLKDEDVDVVMQRVLQHLESTLGATLRE